MSKKNFVYVLVSLCAVLLIINVIIDANRDKPVPVKPTSFSTKEIENKFSEVLKQYNLENEWTTVKYIDNENYDSLKKVFYVRLPRDISIPIIINDIYQAFQSDPVKIEAIERKNYSNSTLKIYSEDLLKMQAFLNHDDGIKRKFAELSFYVLIKNYKGTEEIIDSLLNMHINYNLLLIPGEESRAFLQEVKKNDMVYSVLINDDMEDRFKIEEDYTKQMIKNSVVNLISVYGRNINYIVDTRSNLYNSVIFSFVRDEFSKRDISLSLVTDYSSTLGRDFNDIISLFNFYCESGVSKERIKIIIDFDSFIRLEPLIIKEKKRGTKFSVR